MLSDIGSCYLSGVIHLREGYLGVSRMPTNRLLQEAMVMMHGGRCPFDLGLFSDGALRAGAGNGIHVPTMVALLIWVALSGFVGVDGPAESAEFDSD